MRGAWLPVPGLWAIGNHGVEIVAPDGAHAVEPRAACFVGALAAAAGELRAPRGHPGRAPRGQALEPLAAPPPGAARRRPRARRTAAAVAARHGLRVGQGKEVLELKVPATIDKGTAALALVERLGADAPGAAVLFVGDDVTDEDGFRRSARSPRRHRARRPPRRGDGGRIGAPDPAAVRDLLLAVASAAAAERGRRRRGPASAAGPPPCGPAPSPPACPPCARRSSPLASTPPTWRRGRPTRRATWPR
jgi:hypothetical protein